MMTGNTAFIPLYIKLDNFNVCIFGFGEVGQRRFNKVLKGAPKKCNNFIFNSWHHIKEVTFKEPAYILKLLKEKRIELFD